MADCTHFKRKESQNSARLLNSTAWKSALIGTMCRYYTIIYYYRKIVPSRRKERLLLHGLKGTVFVANLKDVVLLGRACHAVTEIWVPNGQRQTV